MAGKVISVHTDKEWTDQIKQAKESKKLVVVDFTATWCPPCRMMAPLFAQISEALTHVIFLKVDVDELQAVANDWGVEAMPTFIFIKEGNVVEKVVGAQKKDQLEAVITRHAPAPVVAASISA